MVYAYPPARANMVQTDDKSAMARRKTFMKTKNSVILTAEEEAEMLGLDNAND